MCTNIRRVKVIYVKREVNSDGKKFGDSALFGRYALGTFLRINWRKKPSAYDNI